MAKGDGNAGNVAMEDLHSRCGFGLRLERSAGGHSFVLPVGRGSGVARKKRGTHAGETELSTEQLVGCGHFAVLSSAPVSTAPVLIFLTLCTGEDGVFLQAIFLQHVQHVQHYPKH